MASRKRRNTQGSPTRDDPSPSTRDGPIPSPTVVFSYKDRSLLVPRPNNFQTALSLVNKHISPHATTVRFHARVPFVEKEVEITSDAWDLVVNGITEFRVDIVLELDPRSDSSGPSKLPVVNAPDQMSQRNTLAQPYIWKGKKIFFKTLTGKAIGIIANSLDTIDDLKAKIQDKEGVPQDQQLLTFDKTLLEDGHTLSYYSIKPGHTIYLEFRLRGGKPVIYLFPPFPMDVTVGLSLVPEWRFSAIYPMAPVQPSKFSMTQHPGQQVTWRVRAHGDGTLKDKVTGSEISYLFWEAETHAIPPISPPASRLPTPDQDTPNISPTEEFIPGKSVCSPRNSVLLRTQDVPLYLDQALLELGLHTEARTSFITYWLPDILKHPYIALRFIHQASYERAALLNIDPIPDVVTRVFMIFQGVRVEDVHVWSEAEERAKQPVSLWKDTVGADSARQGDSTLFRVLEWGGMEIV